MDVEDSITINEAYASKYEQKKRAEELSKLRDKYGDVGLEDSESSSSDEEEEDENAEMLTDTVEKDFLRTLSLIHSKDPRIYEKDTQFYQKEASDKLVKTRGKGEKPMYLKDYERKQLVERGVMAGVSDSEEEDDTQGKEGSKFATYQEEQEQLKADFHHAVEEGENEGEEGPGEKEGEEGEEGGGLLTLRKKGKEEIEEEERDYVRWLKGEKVKMASGGGDFSGLRNLWTAPDLDSGEAFLRDYVLNRRYIDRDNLRLQVPTYEDIVGDSEGSERGEGEEGEGEEGEGEEGEEVDVSDDEESLNRQEDFERRYNFRFEEPGGDQIVSYPRSVSSSVRREDDRRKERRKVREERREREREQKNEELKRLKKLKRREIKQKLEKIKSITGNPNVGFTAAQLDGDFDPASYDEAMATAFDDGYYMMDDEGGEGEGEGEGKPEFSDDDGDVYDNWDQWQVEQDPHCEDPDFNMDADYDPQTASEQTSSKKSKSLKHRHKLASKLSVKKPLFDPEEKTFDEYFDEYYHLDYEDIIADMPCRFKYRQVAANSFGLSADEVLVCEDKELNQWVSLKKSVQIRTEDEEEKDKRKYKKKARNFKKKYQILTSLKQEPEEEGRRSRKRKNKTVSGDSEKLKQRVDRSGEGEDGQEEEEAGAVAGEEGEGEDRLAASASGRGKGTSKMKSKSKKRRRVEVEDALPTSSSKLKRRKKHKISSSAAKKLSSARLKSYGL